MSCFSVSNKSLNCFSFTTTLVSSFCHSTHSKLTNLVLYLLGKSPTIFNSEYAWHQNLALMQQAQSKTNDSTLKNRIRFLAVNYLNKIAPHMPSVARSISWIFFESAFQVSPFSPYQYHRAFFRYRPDISNSVNQRFALGNKSPLILTDTECFTHFFPLKFIVLNRENRLSWPSLIVKSMETEIEILFDFTQDFGNTILTEKDQGKEKAFCQHFDQIKNEVNAVIHSMDQEERVKAFLKQKSTSISRVRFDCNGASIGGMKVLPLFKDLDEKNVIKTHPTLAQEFVEETGIVLGAIQLRRLVPDVFPLPQHIVPLQSHSKITYKTKEDFIKAVNYKKFAASDKPHVAILGKSFLNMINGLFSISAEKWDEINKDPALGEILQNTLCKILSHLTKAEESIEDDNAYIQAIELAHAELATLLELSTPYQPEDFQQIYLNQLKIVPPGLRPYLKGGLSKSAETVFAEVNAAIKTLHSTPVCASSNWFYFEHSLLMKNNHQLKSSLKDAKLGKIDLYGCAFNPSVDSDDKNTNYVQHDLKADIEKILESSPRLTVAIDTTNDYFNSQKTEQLLKHFESSIHEGRLNFVFFGSGQKFDMLGMDHFYGSPFYIINNGAGHWKPFDKLLTEEVHQTDNLSAQWFCLLYEFAAESVDAFRHQFFMNNRKILQNVPEKLFSKERRITVSRVDAQAELTYIDVKIKGIFNNVIASLLVAYFLFHAVVYKVKASIRGSFGFVHPNVTLIFSNDSTTLRLHAGILHSDNRPIIKFLENIA